MAEKNGKKQRVDVNSTRATEKGLKGLFEIALRKFSVATFMLSLIPIYFLGAIIVGISATPAIYFFKFISDISSGWAPILQYSSMGSALFISYFLYGISLVFVTPFFNKILPFKIKPFRGPYYSFQSVPWYVHNAMIYLVRYTFLEFITPTPLNVLFYKMMGMKIGKGVHINTTNISDAGLIELGDKVTIGGSAHIICHYAAKGYLVIEPVVIKNGSTLGLKSTIMGDVVIGEKSIIAPHEVIYPKSRLPKGYRKDKQSKQTMENLPIPEKIEKN
ncbi:MAG: hypothetical protein D8M58_01600 [Calditrichaeota bacterium]|nr:MAG: hypothetical protein DWQ03_05480 [Calditrichota bacterium]MBL1204064.1 hypothetical protein [Calditrichota bacterium]NOG43895.1 hypothetical protein [Calditrichota bacterium]